MAGREGEMLRIQPWRRSRIPGMTRRYGSETAEGVLSYVEHPHASPVVVGSSASIFRELRVFG